VTPRCDPCIWLFGHGILGDMKKMSCILGNRKTALFYAQLTFNYGIAFLCILPYKLEFKDKLSLIYQERVVNSIAWFDPEQFKERQTSRYFLCLVTQIKDMAYMVNEWFQYHRRIGFDHVIIYDNNSTDNLQSLFHNNDDIEIISWPWRRSQVQAYTHALLFTKNRCVWTLFSDLDSCIFPRSSTSIRKIIENITTIQVAQIHFKFLRMSHENLIKCSNASVTDTYIHRNKLPNAWDKQPFSAVLTSLALPLHGIHRAK
jgi:hypothetical protein